MNSNTKPIVFISYAHDDGIAGIHNFWGQLSSFLKTPKLEWEKWSDQDIMVGQDWDKTIRQALLQECNCCLLLLSERFIKSSYILDTEWSIVSKYNKSGSMFFIPIVYSPLDTLPSFLTSFQVYYPTASDLFGMVPSGVHPDKELCYLDIINHDGARVRFLTALAKKMNDNFNNYLQKPLESTKQSQGDPFLFINNESNEDDLARAIFHPHSYQKRYWRSKSKQHYFSREVDEKLDNAFHERHWILLEGHPLAGKTRAAFEAIKRLGQEGYTVALWSFKSPSQNQKLSIPAFPTADYCIVLMDEFDVILRNLKKMKYSSFDINNFLEQLAERRLLLVATARTGPDYHDFRFGLKDCFWDNVETFSIERLQRREKKIFAQWYLDNFNEELSSQGKFDNHIGSLFIDLEAMQQRWETMGDIVKEHNLSVRSDDAENFLKTVYLFYIMESYKVGGLFVEEHIRCYLQQHSQCQSHESPFAKLGEIRGAASHFFDDDAKWNELILFLSQDKYHLGFIRQENKELVMETAYLDYIVSAAWHGNISNDVEHVFSGNETERERLGLMITRDNFITHQVIPRTELGLKKVIRKLQSLGFADSLYIWNQIISLCPTYPLARKTMNKLQEKGLIPDFISYASLLKTVDDPSVIQAIIKEMKNESIDVNKHALYQLIKKSKKYQTANLLITEIKKMGVILDMKVYCALLNKAHNYAECLSGFDEMKAAGLKPNAFAYGLLIQRANNYATARHVVKKMKESGIQPTHSTYSMLLPKSSSYEIACSVLKEIKDAGMQPSFGDYNHLLSKASNYKLAQFVFEEIKKTGFPINHDSYNHLLQKAPNYEIARTILEEIRMTQLQPNHGNYDHLLQNTPDYETASTVFEEMQREGLKPNHGNYNHLLCKASDYATARTVFEEMHREGLKPNHGNYNYLLCKASDYATARTVFEEMHREGLKPNHGNYDHLLCKASDYATARTVFEEMHREGLKPSNANYDHLLCKASDYATARIVFEEMHREGLKPSNANYDHLLCKASDYATARIVFEEIKKAGWPPHQDNYHILIQKTSSFDIAREVMDEMKTAGSQPSIETYEYLFPKILDYNTHAMIREEMRRLDLTSED